MTFARYHIHLQEIKGSVHSNYKETHCLNHHLWYLTINIPWDLMVPLRAEGKAELQVQNTDKTKE